MINYKLKSNVLNEYPHLYKLYNQIQYVKYVYYIHKELELVLPFDLNTALKIEFDYLHDDKLSVAYKEIAKIVHADNQRKLRLQKRIKYFLSLGNCFFLTLTFDDKKISFEKTTLLTRRRYIQRYLKDNFIHFVANIDFGKKNGREHYHAVVVADSIDNKCYSYGAINFKPIINNGLSDIKISKYITKLSRHAIKDTANGFNLIYSRK